MRAAKSGEKVIQRLLVRKVEHRQPERHAVPVRMKEIICSHTGIEKVARSDAGRIRIVIFRSCRRNAHSRRRELRVGQAARRDGVGQRGKGAAAMQANHGLFVSTQGEGAGQVGHRSGHQPAVVTPGEDRVGTLLILITKVGSLLEGLVVVDAEGAIQKALKIARFSPTRIQSKDKTGASWY